MTILVSDTSVLIDLERGLFLEAMFTCGLALVVPDLLYQNELETNNGPYLRNLGLGVLALGPKELSLVQTLSSEHTMLSIPDCAALVCAKRPDHILMTGDADLRSTAIQQKVTVHGLLWTLDQLEATGKIAITALHAGLSQIAANRRCRLPKAESEARLERWNHGE